MQNNDSVQNPKDKFANPPMPKQEQDLPGSESKMKPQPVYDLESYKGADKLKGKVALITGGDSGIGRSIAILFAKEGADVVISYLDEDKDAKITSEQVEKYGKKCLAISGDISDEAHCQNLIKQTTDSYGHLDILINNAAYQQSHNSIAEISSDEFDYVMKTNVYAMFYLCKAALPIMPEGGSIINTASIQAYKPSMELIHYATTKGAIVTFTKALAQEAAKKGIRVNAVAPGPIWTPLIPASMPKDVVEEFGVDSLFERPGQPVEVAPVYVFLASPEASYITAQIYGVTGGKPLL